MPLLMRIEEGFIDLHGTEFKLSDRQQHLDEGETAAQVRQDLLRGLDQEALAISPYKNGFQQVVSVTADERFRPLQVSQIWRRVSFVASQ